MNMESAKFLRVEANQDKLLYTFQETARQLSISERKLRYMVKADRIQSVKLGGLRMFRQRDLQLFIAQLSA